MKPGEYFLEDGADRGERRAAARRRVVVRNTGDRPVQVGSHYHFFEVNDALRVRSRSGARHAPQHCRRHGGAL